MTSTEENDIALKKAVTQALDEAQAVRDNLRRMLKERDEGRAIAIVPPGEDKTVEEWVAYLRDQEAYLSELLRQGGRA